MKQIRSRITKGGQITLPAEIRKLLGVHVLEEIVFNIEDDGVTIARPKHTLESIRGSVKPATRTEDFDRMIREAQDEGIRNGYGELE